MLVYAEAREQVTSHIRKRIIPLRKGPLTNAMSTVTVTADHLTAASDQLYQRHVHHLSSVPRGQLLKILGVISQLIRGADVDTATHKTESILSSTSSASSGAVFTDVQSRSTVMRSNFARRVTPSDSTDSIGKKEKKRVSFREKPQVQHFTPNSSSDSSESEQISSVNSSLPESVSKGASAASKQMIHLPVLSVSRESGKTIQANDQVSDSGDVKGAKVNDGDDFDEEESFERYDDSESGSRDEAREKDEKQEERRNDEEEEVTTEEVTSDSTEQLQESSHSDRKEGGQLKVNNGWSKSNESLSRKESEPTTKEKEKEKKVIETTFSWNLDSDDEEFVF